MIKKDPVPVFAEELIVALTVTWKLCLSSTTLALLYSGIDSMAYYWMPEFGKGNAPKLEVERPDFEAWVKTYMLRPGSPIAATATDIYAARCSWVHGHGFEARLNRQGIAETILYCTGKHDPAQVQSDWSALPNKPTGVWVSIDDLLRHFFLGVRHTWEDIESDPEKTRIAESRFQTGMSGHMIFPDDPSEPVRQRVSFLDARFEERAQLSLDVVRRVRSWLRGPAYDLPPL